MQCDIDRRYRGIAWPCHGCRGPCRVRHARKADYSLFPRAHSGPTTSRSTNRGSRRPHTHAREVDLATFDISAVQMRRSTTAVWPKPTAHLRVNRGLGGQVAQPRHSPGGTATFCEDPLPEIPRVERSEYVGYFFSL